MTTNPRASETTYHQNSSSDTAMEEVLVLKAELDNSRANVVVAAALAAEREPSGLGGVMIDLVRVDTLLYLHADCNKWEGGRNLDISVVFSCRCGYSRHNLIVRAAVRPMHSLPKHGICPTIASYT